MKVKFTKLKVLYVLSPFKKIKTHRKCKSCEWPFTKISSLQAHCSYSASCRDTCGGHICSYSDGSVGANVSLCLWCDAWPPPAVSPCVDWQPPAACTIADLCSVSDCINSARDGSSRRTPVLITSARSHSPSLSCGLSPPSINSSLWWR